MRVALLVSLAVICAACGSSETPPAADISGSVTCTSRAEVAGIWVEAATGDDDSGFAKWEVTNQAEPWVAAYRYRLPHGGTYLVHVGCGKRPDDPKQWVNENWSTEPVSPPENSFSCDDPSPDQAVGTCRRTG